MEEGKEDPRVWKLTETGRLLLRMLEEKHNRERQEILEAALRESRDEHDNRPPVEAIQRGDVDVSFDGARFIEVTVD